MKRIILGSAFLSAILLLAAADSWAQGAGNAVQVRDTFTYPKSYAHGTDARAISNRGEIVGIFFNATSTPSGFTLTHSRFSHPIAYQPGAATNLTGVNSAGLICGYTGSHGLFYDGHTFTLYDVAGSTFTYVEGLNDAGDFVGVYGPSPEGASQSAFLKTGGNVVSFSVAGSDFTTAYGVNNLGESVGTYSDGPPFFLNHGWYRAADGSITLLDYPGARSTQPAGINDNGTIVGTYEDSNLVDHGFILTLPGTFTSFDAPGAQDTYIRGINNAGKIVGTDINAAGAGVGYEAALTNLLP